ncbi:MAG TPA: hypothetical protein PK867_25285, partial [Pirellulales bacterium]|nr:hypothetical protein [Pirellulales bacterium]
NFSLAESILFFVSETHIDGQSTRGVRELAPDSAQLLDRIIEATDSLPPSDGMLTVTDDLLLAVEAEPRPSQMRLAEEIWPTNGYDEGAHLLGGQRPSKAKQATRNVAERAMARKNNPRVRPSSSQPVRVQGREVPDVESHNGSARSP